MNLKKKFVNDMIDMIEIIYFFN